MAYHNVNISINITRINIFYNFYNFFYVAYVQKYLFCHLNNKDFLVFSLVVAMQRFTDEQIREYNDAFCMFDKDNLGYILSINLRDMLKTIGFNPSDTLLENLTIVIDADGNGKIDFHEFIDLIDKLETEEKSETDGKLVSPVFMIIAELCKNARCAVIFPQQITIR